MKELGQRIRTIRGNRSQQAFSSELGISSRALYSYERGDRSPSADILMSICARTNTDPTWLLTGNGDAPALQEGEPKIVDASHYIDLIDAYNEINKEVKYLRPKLDALRDENSALLKENGALQVEIERLKGRLALLEQNLTAKHG